MGHIVLTTYELHPVNPGGCGVLVDALARTLALSGHRVSVLGDMPAQELAAWRDWAIAQGTPADRLTAITLSSLAPVASGGSLFMAKSEQFARGLRALFARDRFDLVEMHEYAGVALEALSRRWRDGWFASARFAVRIHGSLEFIDAQEDSEADPTRIAMYLMERASMLAADVVFAPSKTMGEYYRGIYGLDAARLRPCSPPMELLIPKWSRDQDREPSNELLVFGKLQEIKGCDLIAQAAVSLFQAEPHLPGKVVFVGADVRCAKHGRMTSECVKSHIPAALSERFEFLPPIPRAQLPSLVGRMRAGIVASRFESFCLAAHELRSLGLPLIVPQRAAFSDFFDEHNAFLFDGTIASLRRAMREALIDDGKITRIERIPPLAYDDVAGIYDEVLAHPPGPQSWSVTLDLLTRQIAHIERFAALAEPKGWAGGGRLRGEFERLRTSRSSVVSGLRENWLDPARLALRARRGGRR